MPGTLNQLLRVDQIRLMLRHPETTVNNAFQLLRALSTIIQREEDSNTAVELTLRALEQRGSFGALGSALDAIARRVGLFPYVDAANLSDQDLIAYECHRPERYDEDIVFHRIQASVYRTLMDGRNVILSAPTSFGKSKIIDAIVSTGKFKNVAVVVPTLALTDETRRRLSRFAPHYKIITHSSQAVSAKNIFVVTAERLLSFEETPRFEFVVIDEFYKLGLHEDGERMVALNEAFYKLNRSRPQFYFLGPNVEQIPASAEGTLNARWIKTDFATVVCDQEMVPSGGSNIERLIALCRGLSEPTIIYCASPKSVNDVANALVEAQVGSTTLKLEPAAQWVGEHFHPDWVLVRALRQGIGIHHGRLPRALGQFIVRSFNSDAVRFLVCTSTLIEGVNTKAKNVVIFDNKIAKNKVDFFTFNNIKGRAGRMFQHFVGRVFLFDDPPDEQLPTVDLPFMTQGDDVPTSLLMQIASADLTPRAAERLREVQDGGILTYDLMRQNHGIDPGSQLALADAIHSMSETRAARLAWRRLPSYGELLMVCELIWEHLVPQERHGAIRSAAQLALKTNQLRQSPTATVRILGELQQPPQFAAKTVDEAVERVLSFDRTWASFELPRYLMAVSRIQAATLKARELPIGDYTFFASQLESLFRPPVLGALDEYGLPPDIGAKLVGRLGTQTDLDVALNALSSLNREALNLSEFESEVLRHVLDGLPATD